jgi:hypothetical protein
VSVMPARTPAFHRLISMVRKGSGVLVPPPGFGYRNLTSTAPQLALGAGDAELEQIAPAFEHDEATGARDITGP